jgi:hypothetical protein
MRSKWYSTTNGNYLDVDFLRVWQDDIDTSVEPIVQNTASTGTTEVVVPEIPVAGGDGGVNPGDSQSASVSASGLVTTTPETATSTLSCNQEELFSEITRLQNRVDELEIASNELRLTIIDLATTTTNINSQLESYVVATSSIVMVDEIVQNVLGNLNLGNQDLALGIVSLNEIKVSKDVADQVTVLSGESIAHVDFVNVKSGIPVVVATQVFGNTNLAEVQSSLLNTNPYAVVNVSQTGFDIVVSKPAEYDMKFNWHALLNK